MAQTWTKDSLRAWLKELAEPGNPKVSTPEIRKALTRALLFLYARQTADEQASAATSHNNGMGFSGIDAEFLTSVARSAERYGSVSERQAPYVAKKLAKYTGQLMEMIDNRTADGVSAVA